MATDDPQSNQDDPPRQIHQEEHDYTVYDPQQGYLGGDSVTRAIEALERHPTNPKGRLVERDTETVIQEMATASDGKPLPNIGVVIKVTDPTTVAEDLPDQIEVLVRNDPQVRALVASDDWEEARDRAQDVVDAFSQQGASAEQLAPPQGPRLFNVNVIVEAAPQDSWES